jgi:hypothetical protein
MTIEQLGSVGEVAAALATIATLFYLANQIRQNTRATRAASFHGVTDSMNHVNVAVAQSPQLTQVWTTGVADRDSLDAEERHQFDLLLLSYFHVFETVHYQARMGAGEGDLLIAEERSLLFLLSNQGVWNWWKDNPYAYGPEFRDYIAKMRVRSESLEDD